MEQDFATLVRQYRRDMGWTQTELSEQWSYSFETISAWERRKRTPSHQEIHRLSGLLEVDEEELSAIVTNSKGQTRSRFLMASRQPSQPTSEHPFPSGRHLWSLHLGMSESGLQCVISCPLPSGASWQVVLDPGTDFGDIQQVYQLINEHVCRKTGEQVPHVNAAVEQTKRAHLGIVV